MAKISSHAIVYAGEIGNGTLIDAFTLISYPTKDKLEKSEFEKLITGARIGNNCIIRSGSVIYERVLIGNNVKIGHNVIIREGSTIEDGATIGTNSELAPNVKIGKLTRIMGEAHIATGTTIGNHVFIAPNVVITNSKHMNGPNSRLDPPIIEDGVKIGAGTIVLPGVKIGTNAVIGAGTVVTKNVPGNTLVFGNPGRVVSR